MIDHHSLKIRRTLLATLVASSLLTLTLTAGTSTALARPHRAIDRPHGAIDRTHDGNSSAVAVNTTDNSLVFDLTFAVLNVTGQVIGNQSVVDNQNVADAYASCTGCETVAISIQTLLVQGVANVITPINEASARNQNCQQCDTVAVAYQFVIAPGTTIKLTPEGRREVAYIRRQLELLRRDALRTGMTGAQIVDAVGTLMKQYAAILNTQIVPTQPGTGPGSGGAVPPTTGTSSTQVTSSTPNPGASTTTSTTTPPPSNTTPTTTCSAAECIAGTTPTTPPTEPTSSTTTGTTPTTTGTTSTDTTPTTSTTSTTPTTSGTTSTDTTPTTSTTGSTTTTSTSTTPAPTP